MNTARVSPGLPGAECTGGRADPEAGPPASPPPHHGPVIPATRPGRLAALRSMIESWSPPAWPPHAGWPQ